MRVILTDHITDHTGRLLVGFVPVVAEHVHGEQDAPVHRLEAIAHIRQGTADDDAHGVIQIGLFELLLDVDLEDFFG